MSLDDESDLLSRLLIRCTNQDEKSKGHARKNVKCRNLSFLI